MRDSNDFNRCREHQVDNAEWKVAHDVAPVLDVDSWLALRRFGYRECGTVDVRQKCRRGLGITLMVPTTCCFQFIGGQRMEANR
jgi:hypothetical protein